MRSSGSPGTDVGGSGRKRPVTLRVLAERAGVSVAVVSAVINDSPYVRMSPATRARVVAEIERAGYVPNQAARSLRLQRSMTIAVVLPALHHPIFQPALEGIYEEAERHGYVIMLGEAHHLASGSGLMERVVARGGVDGLLVRTTSSLLDSTIAHVQAAGTPMLSLEQHPGGIVPSVAIDEAAGISTATTHLVRLGHRRLGFYGGETGYRGTRVRTEAFRRTLADAGLAVDEHAVRLGPQEPWEAYEPVRRFLEERRDLTALVCNNVTTALAVSAAAHDLGIDVPGELSVIAFHDIPDAAMARPAISAVRMPMRELGEHGVLALLRMVAGGSIEDEVIDVAPELIDRGSAAPPR